MTNSKKFDKPTYRNCTACTFIRYGVKTRKSIPHTCGKSLEQIHNFIKEIRKQNGPETEER